MSKKTLQRLLAVLVFASLVLSACAEAKIIASGTLKADANTSVSYEVNEYADISWSDGADHHFCWQGYTCSESGDAKVWTEMDDNGKVTVYTSEYQP